MSSIDPASCAECADGRCVVHTIFAQAANVYARSILNECPFSEDHRFIIDSVLKEGNLMLVFMYVYHCSFC